MIHTLTKQKIYRLSRPRFWLYVLGPYLIGIIASYPRYHTPLWLICLFGIYFLFPANILIYGVNDIFDHDTDQWNDKKKTYESSVAKKEQKALWYIITMSTLPFVCFLIFLPWQSIGIFFAFLFFGIGYSAPPIRAKTIPILDSMFNILYFLPGAFAYTLVTNNIPPLSLWLLGLAWCMAMHAYSAIPDIEADQKAKLHTIATFFGKNVTLVLCALLYGIVAYTTAQFFPLFGISIGILYIGLLTMSFAASTHHTLLRIYSYFPYVNMVMGGIAYWLILLSKM